MIQMLLVQEHGASPRAKINQNNNEMHRVLLVALAALWTIQRSKLVVSVGPSQRVFDLDYKLTQLYRSFQDGYRRLYYGPWVAAVHEQYYPLLELAIEMVECEAILYAYQRQGLLAAQEIINKYFVARRAPLNPMLVPSSDLVDMIIMRSIAQSIKNGFYAIEHRRKRIYLIEKKHEYHPKVLALTRIYARYTVTTEVKETKAGEKFAELLNSYKDIVPFLWTAGHDSQILSAIDELLREVTGPDLDETGLLKRYVDPEVLVEVVTVRHRSQERFEPLLPEQVRSVSMKDVVLHEDKVMQESEGNLFYLKDLDRKLELIDERFEQTMQEIFYDQQHLGITKGNFPLLAVSSYMADCEALMYAEERSMLTVMRDLIEQHEPEASLKLVNLDKNLIYIVEHRLFLFAIGSIIARSAERQKKLYLMLKRYDIKDGVKELAREHILHINDRKSQLRDIQMSLHMYLQNFWGELPERKQMVELMVEKGISLWSAGLTEAHLQRTNLNSGLLKDLNGARQKAFKNIYRPSGASIDAVTAEDIAKYESELLSGPMIV